MPEFEKINLSVPTTSRPLKTPRYLTGILRKNVFPLFESNVPSKEANQQEYEDEFHLRKFLTLNKSKDSTNSFFRSMRKVLLVAQCFSMMPVQGFNSKDSSNLRFKWLSFRVAYSIITIICAFSLFIFAILQLKYLNLGIQSTSGTVFHGSTTFILITFLYYAPRWPALVHRWETVEQELSPYGNPPKMAFRINFITAFILIAAFVEHFLSNLQTLYQVYRCENNSKINLNLYYEFSLVNGRALFIHVPYHFLLSLYIIVVRLICTFSWNFLDLFIMILTFSLAERFKQINMGLYKIEGKANIPEAVWQRYRLDYNALTRMTKFLDDEIAVMILLSFGNNLFFICLQLFNSIKPLASPLATLYFYWSFLYLIIRTSLVSFFCSRINDQSKIPARILYSVPPVDFCIEVERFIQHVTSDQVAITGMGFFTITRNILITIAGTIITYEIVIVQLNGHDDDNGIPINTTSFC